MYPKLRRGSIGILILCGLIFTAGAILGTQDYMTNEFPWCKNFRCAICHTSSNPTSDPQLNDFGADFRDNGFSWDTELAGMDSDGDGYPNGIELGDSDGNGTPEVAIERSNPGDPLNYPSSIDPRTWSVIKNLFAERLR